MAGVFRDVPVRFCAAQIQKLSQERLPMHKHVMNWLPQIVKRYKSIPAIWMRVRSELAGRSVRWHVNKTLSFKFEERVQ